MNKRPPKRAQRSKPRDRSYLWRSGSAVWDDRAGWPESKPRRGGAAEARELPAPDLADPVKAVPVRQLWVVPKRWVKAVIGVFMLPIVWIWTQAFFGIVSRETIHHGFWATEEFWFFCLGSILWVIAFFGLPRPVVVYVFGHELTHAVWVWLMGGRVSAFKVQSDGGYIITNRQNFWIALAPYFYPIYSVAVVILYGLASCFWDMSPYTRWLFLALGITWTFHITFTLWMIPQGQSDLSYHGTFFSLVVIYWMNLVLLTGLVLLIAPHATLSGFAGECLRNTGCLFSGVEWIVRSLRHAAG